MGTPRRRPRPPPSRVPEFAWIFRPRLGVGGIECLRLQQRAGQAVEPVAVLQVPMEKSRNSGAHEPRDFATRAIVPARPRFHVGTRLSAQPTAVPLWAGWGEYAGQDPAAMPAPI